MTTRENRRSRITYYALVLVALLALAPLPGVFAQEANPNEPSDDEVNAIAKELYCPVCENVPLDVCGTQACAQWRDLIREKLVAGWSEDEIKTYFANQYGDRVLAEPPARGFNWLVYIIPPLIFFAGAFFLYRGFRAWRRVEPEPASAAVEPEIQDEYLARLEEELRKQ